MGINLLDCIDSDLDKVNENIYKKITEVCEGSCRSKEIQIIATEYGIPIVQQAYFRYSDRWWAALPTSQDFVTIAKTLDRAAKTVGVNFIGGYSALVSKGMTPAEELSAQSLRLWQSKACVQFCKRRVPQKQESTKNAVKHG